jgi:hypothetical protein
MKLADLESLVRGTSPRSGKAWTLQSDHFPGGDLSLVVHPYSRDPRTDEVKEVDSVPMPPHNDLAGAESWRKSFYGSPQLLRLGLRLLPELAMSDLYVDNQELDELISEVKLIRTELQTLSADLGLRADSVQFRLDNILEAVRLARLVNGGGVYIG